jgi:release factor glutamine methyltransferase
MKIASTKIPDVMRFFREELKDIYEPGEVETFISYCLEAYLGLRKTDLLVKAQDRMSESELLKFNFAVKQLKQQRPIQYILGKADFYKLQFVVNEQVLIPRPETEELVDLIIRDLKQTPAPDILDIGTGSGCIAITLKKNITTATIAALDVSEEALNVARQNAALNQATVSFFQQDILNANTLPDNAPRLFDCIVSNPPYICISEKKEMHKNVLEHEPHLALFVPDEDPLLFYKVIADFALSHLKPKGKLYFEINAAYGLETSEMLEKKGFKNVILISDLNNKNRILQGSLYL